MEIYSVVNAIPLEKLATEKFAYIWQSRFHRYFYGLVTKGCYIYVILLKLSSTDCYM